jgi:hypothetical protein
MDLLLAVLYPSRNSPLHSCARLAWLAEARDRHSLPLTSIVHNPLAHYLRIQTLEGPISTDIPWYFGRFKLSGPAGPITGALRRFEAYI